MSFLELRQVSFSYTKKMNPVVTGVNLELHKNEVTAIVGPNGSGKTTLTKLMIGVLHATEGEVYLEGYPIVEYSLAEIGCRIGYIFQNPEQQLFCSSVAEEIAFGLSKQGCEPGMVAQKVDFYLDYFELAAYRNVFPMYLSQGEKQRLAIAAVLANEPEFLILDEPTIGLDAYHKRLLEDYLHKVAGLGRGMLLVSHDMAFVNKMAKRLISMEKGRIQSDSGLRGETAYDA